MCVLRLNLHDVEISQAKDITIFHCPCPGWRTSPYELYCSDVEIRLFTWRLVSFTSCHLIGLQVDRHSIRRLKLIHQVQLIHHQVQLSAFDLGKKSVDLPLIRVPSSSVVLSYTSKPFYISWNTTFVEKNVSLWRDVRCRTSLTSTIDLTLITSSNLKTSIILLHASVSSEYTWVESDRATLRYTSFLSNTDDKMNRIIRQANPIFQYDLHHSDTQMSECRRKLFVLSWVEHENQIECQKDFFFRTDQRRSEIIIQIDDHGVVKRPAHNGGTQKTMIRWQRICSYWIKISVVLITSTRFWSKKTCSKRHPRSMWRSVFVDGYQWKILLSKICSASWLLKILRKILEKRICSRKMSV